MLSSVKGEFEGWKVQPPPSVVKKVDSYKFHPHLTFLELMERRAIQLFSIGSKKMTASRGISTFIVFIGTPPYIY